MSSRRTTETPSEPTSARRGGPEEVSCRMRSRTERSAAKAARRHRRRERKTFRQGSSYMKESPHRAARAQRSRDRMSRTKLWRLSKRRRAEDAVVESFLGRSTPICIGGNSPFVRFLDPKSIEEVFRIQRTCNGRSLVQVPSPDDPLRLVVAVGDDDRSGKSCCVTLYDVSLRSSLVSLNRHTKSVRGLASFVHGSCGGPFVVSGGDGDSQLLLWDASLGSVVHSLPDPPDRTMKILKAERSSSLSCEMFVGGEKGKLFVYDVWQGVKLSRLMGGSGHKKVVRALALNPARNLLISTGDDWFLKVWDYRNTDRCELSSELAYCGTSLCCTENCLFVGLRDGTVEVWDIRRTNYRMRLIRPTPFCEPVSDIEKIDDAHFASSSRGIVTVWDPLGPISRRVVRKKDFGISSRIHNIRLLRRRSYCEDFSSSNTQGDDIGEKLNFILELQQAGIESGLIGFPGDAFVCVGMWWVDTSAGAVATPFVSLMTVSAFETSPAVAVDRKSECDDSEEEVEEEVEEGEGEGETFSPEFCGDFGIVEEVDLDGEELGLREDDWVFSDEDEDGVDVEEEEGEDEEI